MDEDWDNLFILDACRWDIFHDLNNLDGREEKRISHGTSTAEFLKRNFDEGNYPDTIYVTANPMIYKKDIDVTFHSIEHVWLDKWDDNEYTVPPESMTERVQNVNKKFPNKRLLIHYNQPHHPFLGPTADEHFDFSDYVDPIPEGGHIPFWEKVRRGQVDVTDKTLKTAYRETLERTLPAVEEATKSLVGKTVITADHGELFNEPLSPIKAKGYGHPRGIYVDSLTNVPWLIIDKGERKEIKTDDKIKDAVHEDAEATANERLRHLGYVMDE